MASARTLNAALPPIFQLPALDLAKDAESAMALVDTAHDVAGTADALLPPSQCARLDSPDLEDIAADDDDDGNLPQVAPADEMRVVDHS